MVRSLLLNVLDLFAYFRSSIVPPVDESAYNIVGRHAIESRFRFASTDGNTEQSGDDEEISAVYTEPFWSNDVGVRVYRRVDSLPGLITLGAGLAISAFCAFQLVGCCSNLQAD